MDNGVDYRRRTLEQLRLYHTPLGAQADAEMTEAFNRLAESQDENPVLHIEAREIRARRKAGGVVWFDFKTLCGGPRSQNDYLGDRLAVPHRAAQRCAPHAGAHGVRGAPLHLVDRRAV